MLYHIIYSLYHNPYPELVTARRSILGPLAEGRQGPSFLEIWKFTQIVFQSYQRTMDKTKTIPNICCKSVSSQVVAFGSCSSYKNEQSKKPPFGNDVAHNRWIRQLWKTFLGMFCHQIILICPQLLDFDSCSSYHGTPAYERGKFLIWKELSDMVDLLLETCFDSFPSWSKSFLWNTASTCILGLSEKL